MTEFLVFIVSLVFWGLILGSFLLISIFICCFIYDVIMANLYKNKNDNSWIEEDMLWEPDKDCNYKTSLVSLKKEEGKENSNV